MVFKGLIIEFGLAIIFSFFLIGFFGLFNSRKNLILILLSCEIILLGTILGISFLSIFFQDLFFEYFVLMLLVLGGSEAVIALAVLIIFYRMRGGLDVMLIKNLKG